MIVYRILAACKIIEVQKVGRQGDIPRHHIHSLCDMQDARYPVLGEGAHEIETSQAVIIDDAWSSAFKRLSS